MHTARYTEHTEMRDTSASEWEESAITSDRDRDWAEQETSKIGIEKRLTHLILFAR